MTAALGSRPSSSALETHWLLVKVCAWPTMPSATRGAGRRDGRGAAVRVGGHDLDAQPAAAVAAVGHVGGPGGAGDVRQPCPLLALPAVAVGQRAVAPGAGRARRPGAAARRAGDERGGRGDRRRGDEPVGAAAARGGDLRARREEGAVVDVPVRREVAAGRRARG